MSILASLDPPTSWQRVPFGRVAERSKEAGRPELPPLSVFLGAGVVPRDSRDDNHNQLGEDMSKYLVVRPGDLVFNKLRTWQGGLGASRHEGIVSPAYFVCRPGPAYDSTFLQYLLLSDVYLQELTRVSKWQPPSQFDIGWEQLRAVPIIAPPLRVQRAIADYLNRETVRIDALITKKQRMIKLVDEAVVRAIDDALTLGEGVPCVRLGYVARLQTGLTLDSNRDAGQGSVTWPYLRVANVQAGSLDLDDVKEVTVPEALAARARLRPGDVLMTEGGDLDKLGRGTVWTGQIEPCLHQNHVFAVRCDSAKLLPDFLAYVTRTTHARMYFESTGTRSTNLASTNSSKVLSFRLPVPSIQEQTRLADSIAQTCARSEHMKGLLAHQIELLREHRQALITAAVTGEIEVPGVAA